MNAIDAYGEFELPEEKSKIEVAESLVKKVEACGKFLVSYKITPDEIKQKLSEGYENVRRLGYLFGKIDNSLLEVEDIYVPVQDSDEYSSDINAIELERAVKKLKDILKTGKQIVGYARYWHSFPVFESPAQFTSRKIFESKLGNPVIGFIANKKGEYKIFE